MAEQTRRPMTTIYLIGFSGSGKSTVGQLLADTLKVPFVDTDHEIESTCGMTIPEIFAAEGEKYFREVEAAIATEIAATSKRIVVSLGGGSFEQESLRDAILSSGISVYLACDEKELYYRLKSLVDRPLLNQSDLKERIRTMMQQRKPHYELAHLSVDTSTLTPEQTCKAIVTAIEEYNRAH